MKSAESIDKPVARDGLSQEERLFAALNEHYFDVDELRFEDLLAMAAEYSTLLGYRNNANQLEGNWRDLFDADEAAILAALLSSNFRDIAKEASSIAAAPDAYLEKLRVGQEPWLIPSFWIAARIDSWLTKLKPLQSVAALRAYEKISDVIEKRLGQELWAMLHFLEQNQVACDSAMDKLSGAWQQNKAARAAVPDAGRFFKSNFYAFLNSVHHLQDEIAEILLLSLKRRDHDPAIGLLIAFLQLFRKIQDRLNSFTRNHLKFYYEDVLHTRRLAFVPDSTCILFNTDVPGREVLIPKDTEFSGGQDELGVELFYAAENELLVRDAKVSGLLTLYFDRDRLVSPGNSLSTPNFAQQFVTGAIANRAGEYAKHASPDQPQPLFGMPQRAKDRSMMGEARLGFAVASNVLLLQQGLRDITLTFKLADRGSSRRLLQFTRQLRNILETTRVDAFYRAFRNMFRIAFTSTEGWLEVSEYLPDWKLSETSGKLDCALSFKLSLPDSAAPIVPYSPTIHGENFNTGLPVARLVINPDSYVYAYSLLSEIFIREVVVEAEVRGCTNVLVYNQAGALNAAAQFNPFGAMPSAGNFLVIGCHEAARKKLTDFEVELEWGGLPLDAPDFETYYRDYAFPPGHWLFKAELSVLRDRQWLPEESKQPEALLFTANAAADQVIAAKRIFSFAGICNFSKPLMSSIAPDAYGYDSASKDGFFKLRLSNPPQAFGHQDYPQILSRVMTANAILQKGGLSKLLSRAVPPKPLPRPPYTPLVNTISINYKAVSTISLEQSAADETEALFHLHPFGIERFTLGNCGVVSLAPRYEASGNLFIAITATRLSGPLTLFFHLRDDSLPEACTGDSGFKWHYLSGNRWKPLEKSQVLSDTTHGFLTSGIVTLEIPADINTSNTIMPDGLFWLQVSASGNDLDTLCSLYGIYTNALTVNWRMQDGNSLKHLADQLPAGRIKSVKSSIPGIGDIRQIVASSGGSLPESETQQTIRVSERLRHKNRAITPQDYEKLVLQRFPEIFKVKCFPCMTGAAADGWDRTPGHVLVVLIPYLKNQMSENFRPMVNATLLDEVREFLRGLTSPHVTVHVRNPSYEQVQLYCKLSFRDGVAHGYHLNILEKAVSNYLSPWNTGGVDVRFDWRIRSDDIRSYIQKFDYVQSISALSLRKIIESDSRRRHHLFDTRRAGVKEIEPSWPWSIAIPARQHLIETEERKGFVETGISNLTIGSTFILSRGV